MLSLCNGCLVLIWKLLILAHTALFGFIVNESHMLPRLLYKLDKLLIINITILPLVMLSHVHVL